MFKLLVSHVLHYMGLYAVYTNTLNFFQEGKFVFIFDTQLMPFFILLGIVNIAVLRSKSTLLTGTLNRDVD
ncbi:hypothetical protein DRW07_11755 [Alteromonas sediminis]|uniref:Uncharacterized protein n=1 Tax=Alteromonas sediminis TaxID=2259342 RepID=A0A3N5Z7P6_9ALTE|nr:hypothetical protein [Alteromonas sediminis]RPJ66744.1 hypothetical protein DRW07_11755 [Alteromonas sediminis]